MRGERINIDEVTSIKKEPESSSAHFIDGKLLVNGKEVELKPADDLIPDDGGETDKTAQAVAMNPLHSLKRFLFNEASKKELKLDRPDLRQQKFSNKIKAAGDRRAGKQVLKKKINEAHQHYHEFFDKDATLEDDEENPSTLTKRSIRDKFGL